MATYTYYVLYLLSLDGTDYHGATQASHSKTLTECTLGYVTTTNWQSVHLAKYRQGITSIQHFADTPKSIVTYSTVTPKLDYFFI